MLFLPDFLPPFAGSVRRHRITTIMIASRGSMEKRVWSILYVLYGYGIHCWSLQRQMDKGLTPKGAWIMISGKGVQTCIKLPCCGWSKGQVRVGLGWAGFHIFSFSSSFLIRLPR
jgi:hypothetical protein